MARTVVYRWHLDPDLKRRLEAAARAERTSVARLLDRIAREWLAKRAADDEAEQRRLHAEAEKWIGSINSGDPYGSEQVKERVRAKLMAKHERLQRQAPASGERIGSLSLGEGPYTRKRIRERVRARLTEKRKRRHRCVRSD